MIFYGKNLHCRRIIVNFAAETTLELFLCSQGEFLRLAPYIRCRPEGFL